MSAESVPAGSPLRILTYTAPGAVLPHSLADMREALRQLGHSVFVQDLMAIGRRAEPGHDLDVAIIDGVISVEPDYIVTIDSAGLVPAYLAVMPCRRKIVSWFYDDPLENFREKGMDFRVIAPDYHIFCWDRAYIPALRELGFVHSAYMPFATNPDVHYPRARGQYSYDVSFVGHCTPQRADCVGELARAGIAVDVFGDDAWEKLEHPNVKFHGSAEHHRDAPEIYSRSRINLNITNAQLVTSVPVRVFDVLACEGFLLTDHRQDVAELFAPGEELALYASSTDLVNKVRYYLERPAERRRIAAAGMRRVRNRFTFRTQLSSILRQTGEADEIERGSVLPKDEALLALWLTGLSYLKFGRYAEAESQLLSAQARKPSEPSLLLALAVLANYRKRAREVASWVDRLGEVQSEFATFGSELVRSTERGETISCWDLLYADLQDVSPRWDGTVEGWEPTRVGGRSRELARRGASTGEQKRYPGAREMAERQDSTETTSSDDLEARIYEGTRLVEAQEYAAAFSVFGAARERFGDQPRLLLGLANVSFHMGNPYRTFELLQDAHALDPGDPDIVVTWASAAEKLGRLAELREPIRRAAELSPDDEELRLLCKAFDSPPAG